MTNASTSASSAAVGVHGRPRPVHVLVITPSALERPSSAQLRLLLATMVDRSDVAVDVWFLRHPWYGDALADLPTSGRDPWTVDSLRTWLPAHLLELVGARRLAGGLRGWRLRRRLREVHPDLVLLDDGFGDRLFGGGEDVVRVARLNADGSAATAAGLEEPVTREVDLWLVAPGTVAPTASGPTRHISPHLAVMASARALADPAVRCRARSRLGISDDDLVVSGWGSTSWIDGPELFIRALWALEARHGRVAHGVWVAPELEVDDAARLRAEAERCGVADRYHLVTGGDELWACADAVFLPFRCRGEREVLDAIAAGLPVVAFEAVGWAEVGATSVPDLDIDAAAAALADVRPEDRPARLEEARHLLDPDGLVDELVALVDQRARR